MSAKKNQGAVIPVRELKAIRLKPSATDYATSARTTADAMGLTGPVASKTKPNMLLLSLVTRES